LNKILSNSNNNNRIDSVDLILNTSLKINNKTTINLNKIIYT